MATIASALTAPDVFKRLKLLEWQKRFGNEASPPTLDNTVQVRNSNGGGLWSAALDGVQIRSRADRLAWQATDAQMKGGLEPINLPHWGDRPRPADLSAIVVAVVGNTAARAVAMRIVLTNTGTLSAGMHFSDYDAALYGWRLYCIATVAAVMGQPTQRDITFWPPLRFAAADAHALEFEAPRCVMKLATSDAMRLQLEILKRGDPSAQFIEAF